MRVFIEQAKALDIEFDYETSVKMELFDVGEALTNERARLDEIGLPTLVHDDLMAKIEDEFRMLATKYKCQKARSDALTAFSSPTSGSEGNLRTHRECVELGAGILDVGPG
jgi:hypothetical protein